MLQQAPEANGEKQPAGPEAAEQLDPAMPSSSGDKRAPCSGEARSATPQQLAEVSRSSKQGKANGLGAAQQLDPAAPVSLQRQPKADRPAVEQPYPALPDKRSSSGSRGQAVAANGRRQTTLRRLSSQNLRRLSSCSSSGSRGQAVATSGRRQTALSSHSKSGSRGQAVAARSGRQTALRWLSSQILRRLCSHGSSHS